MSLLDGGSGDTGRFTDWQAPEVIDGRYRVLRRVGRGGFADVYLAEHVNVAGLMVAIKVLMLHEVRDLDMKARFQREAVALASLRGRHTVRVHDAGVVDDCPYLVMEFLENVSLGTLLAEKGSLSHGQVARVAMGVLKALVEAHSLGIVHRDLKPDNVLLTAEVGERHPVPRVIDFGIAKLLATPARGMPGGQTTGGNIRFCTPEYAAPEVLEGNPGYQSDLYSLGHTMAELLDGTTPYAAKTVIAAAALHLDGRPVPLGPMASRGPLGRVIARACSKSLEARYHSAGAMLVDVAQALRAIEAAEGPTEPIDIGPWLSIRVDELRFVATDRGTYGVPGIDPTDERLANTATLGFDDPLVTGERPPVRDTDGHAPPDFATTIVPVPRARSGSHPRATKPSDND